MVAAEPSASAGASVIDDGGQSSGASARSAELVDHAREEAHTTQAQTFTDQDQHCIDDVGADKILCLTTYRGLTGIIHPTEANLVSAGAGVSQLSPES